MNTNNIISFADYLKRKQSNIAIDKEFLDVLSNDIKSKPELIAWYNFQSTFNKHKLFLNALYTSNHQDDKSNPNAGYFIAFTENQIDIHLQKILEANEWIERETIFVDAKNCTFRNMAGQLYGTEPKSVREAWEMFYEMLLGSNNVVVISGISKSKIASMKSSYARGILKINDDAHFKKIYPESDIIYVDSAAFLERSWMELGTYIDIFA